MEGNRLEGWVSILKFVALVQGKPVPVELERTDDRYTCNIDGRNYVVDAITLGPLAYSILLDGKSYEVALEKHDTHFTAHFTDHTMEFDVCEARKFKAAALAKKQASSGAVKIESPMPGKIVKVTAVENATVQEGDPLVIMEAMKMQNEFRAPRSGVVRKIAIKEGDTIQAHQTLVIIE